MEHIAPVTERPKSGYDEYDEKFKNEYLHCLGNYLLISEEHNIKIGNKPFKDKRSSYRHLRQQKEIQKMTEDEHIWTKDLIKKRKEKIMKFIISSF